MSDRNKPHNGRDTSGQFKVKREDVDDQLTNPDGVDVIRDDVRLGGAVEDVGLGGVERARQLGDMIEENRENVDRLTGRDEGRDEGRDRGRGRGRAR